MGGGGTQATQGKPAGAGAGQVQALLGQQVAGKVPAPGEGGTASGRLGLSGDDGGIMQSLLAILGRAG